MGAVRQKPGKDRPQEILDAAARVITECGLAETRISDIAEQAGVSPGLILYYFESKDRLLAEALTFANDQFLPTDFAPDPQDRERQGATAPADRSLRSGIPSRVRPPRRVGAVDRGLGPRSARPADGEGPRGSRPALARSDRRHIRAGQGSGEFPQKDAGELALRLGALIDGLAIQIIMNDAQITPEKMHRACMEVAAHEIGFDLEPPD